MAPKSKALRKAGPKTPAGKKGPIKARTRPKPGTIDDYLAVLGVEQREALQKLRMDIHAAAPGAEECISYQIPAFRLQGKLLVAFGAWANHCAFYPGAVVQDLGLELKDYDTSKGTIRFLSSRPLPAVLVRKLVKARVAKNRV